MKKSFLILSLFLTACSFVSHYDTEFKNPVFYQPLRPLSRATGYAYLTPTTVDFRGILRRDITIYTGKCDLIENKQNQITLKCKGQWDDGTKHNSYYTFVSKGVLNHISNCLHILGYYYNKPEDFPKHASYNSYCATPLNTAKLKPY